MKLAYNLLMATTTNYHANRAYKRITNYSRDKQTQSNYFKTCNPELEATYKKQNKKHKILPLFIAMCIVSPG